MKTIQKLFVVMACALFTGSLSAGEKDAPALDGYCPVCYIAAGKAVKGSAEFQTEYAGKTYYFAKQGALDAFVAEPTKFLPAYDGLCAYGMSLGKKFASDPTVFEVVDGKIYLNSNKEIGAKFSKKPTDFITKANAEWKKIEMTMKEQKAKG